MVCGGGSVRKIAFDLGDVRIGIATSDIMGIIASGYETYTRKKNDFDADVEYLAALVKEKQCDTIILGLPINMDGTEGARAEVSREWGAALAAKTGLPVVYQDERLTTVSAEKMLISGGVRRENRKKVIDKVAATLILQAYLDKINY